MRLPGDADGCREAARELVRAARAMDGARDRVGRLTRHEWSGVAALTWSGARDQRVEAVQAQAAALATAGAAVQRFGDTLEDLQQRAARLTADAADHGLALGDGGWIAPVPDAAHDLDPDLLREVARRREVRRWVCAAAADVLAELRVAHDRLLCELDGRPYAPPQQGEQVGEQPAWWAPTWWDAPSLALSGSSVAAQVRQSMPSFLRSMSATGGLGFGAGVAIDLSQGSDVGDALTKNATVTLVATGAAAGTAAVAASAPLWVAGAAAAAAGGVVAYGTGKVFDSWGHHLPWVQHPSERTARRSSGRLPRSVPLLPTVEQHAQQRPRHVVHRASRPAPGPAVGR